MAFSASVSIAFSSALCQQFGIGKTQLRKLSLELYSCGIFEHIRNLRLTLLLHSRKELSLKEIADRCGFADYNYFIAVFSQAEGCSPGMWQKTKE